MNSIDDLFVGRRTLTAKPRFVGLAADNDSVLNALRSGGEVFSNEGFGFRKVPQEHRETTGRTRVRWHEWLTKQRIPETVYQDGPEEDDEL